MLTLARDALIYLACILGLVLLLSGVATKVRADEEHMQMYHGDPRYDEFFRSLKTPEGYSCCSLNDCERVEADWKDGKWWTRIDGELLIVPPDKVIETPLSVDGEAYACTMASPGVGQSPIRCFIPPIPSY